MTWTRLQSFLKNWLQYFFLQYDMEQIKFLRKKIQELFE